MSRPAIAAWVFCGASVALGAARIVLAIADPASSDAASAPGVSGGGVPVAVFEGVTLAAIAVIGALVASREPRNPIGWILSAISFFLGVLIFTAHLFWALYLGDERTSGAALFVAWLGWSWVPAMVPALTLFPLYFPSGRPPTPRWRWVEWLALLCLPTMFVNQAFVPGRFEEYPVANPVGAEGGLGTIVDVLGPGGVRRHAHRHGGGCSVVGGALPPLPRRGTAADKVGCRRGGAVRRHLRLPGGHLPG